MTRRVLSAGAVALAAATAAPAGAQELSFSQVERGRYLVTAANCVACHTDIYNNGERFAGGRELRTPFGVIYSANITFDNDTGIGAWTRDDFYRALHEGVSRDGRNLYPAMPYPNFTLIPRQDVDAIYDYLRSLEPVRAEKPENELPFPFNVREAVTGWNLLYFEQGNFVADPNQSDEWNTGRYLVDGPAHCGACHTGKNFAGADVDDEYLRGGLLDDWLAPNIRGGENGGLANWTQEEIVEFLATGRNRHTAAMVRMGEVIVLSTQNLAQSDLEAIAVYLKSLDDRAPDPVDRPSDEVLAAGSSIFFDNCAACHAADGSGVPGIFAPLRESNMLGAEDPTTVVRIVLEGAMAIPTEAHPGPLGMPAFDWKLTDDQIADVLTFLRSSWGNVAPAVDPGDVADLRERLEEHR
jgi:mono/diheme cytochrome c family protein